jgi:hypothetical protein
MENSMISEFFREAGPRDTDSQVERAWKYVGRFLWGFAMIESSANQIFEELFNLSAGATLIFLGNLDFRKKLMLIDVGLKHRGVKDQSGILHRAHKLADIRNVVAHFSFGPDEVIPGEEGVFFDHVNKAGELTLPHRTKTQAEDGKSVITYSEFDGYDAEAREIFDALENMQGTFRPIVDVESDLVKDIQEVIASSTNAIIFPKRPPDPR